MERKLIEPLTVAYVERVLTIPDIKILSMVCGKLIETELRRQDISVTGPWIFVANNLPHDGKTLFTMRFCLPVSEGINDSGEVKSGILPGGTCISSCYTGNLRSLFTRGYAPVVRYLKGNRIPVTGESREVYHNWFGAGSEENNIELQFFIR
ncbi:GyrI-like domain-containing protein [Enterobacillus tribolii]|uniref:GyrI-like small molecule binding protein n=1 Tax=Enterobacillus tribolii TaxID=1487935 RepID=A0A370R3L5_9GAMM|nr:GyrI-like domain-containing protein [Enterobacillus tribolii]MBW7984647.1 AraC family transcriptional regulator [Enterobacillus tribolii]RDK96645.1 GyrI-like small molecule binding protein [Enterobacillus tribolii]